MTKKTRLIILAICIVLFLVITPYIVLFSLGYRVDIGNLKITATGGIYVKALPQGASVIVDNGKAETIGILFPYVFLQNLLPGNHGVLVKKAGYEDYRKNLEIKEKAVTKLENVILFKKDIPFAMLDNGADYFYMAPNENYVLTAKIELGKINFKTINVSNGQKDTFLLVNQKTKINNLQWSGDSKKALLNLGEDYYLLQPFLNPSPSNQGPATAPTASQKITLLPYLTGVKEISFEPQNSDQIFYIKNRNLYSNKKNLPVIKNTAAYQIRDNAIVWLSYAGFLFNTDMNGSSQNPISLKPFPVKTGNAYQIIISPEKLLLKENESLFLLDAALKSFENFYAPVSGTKISPDGQKLLYFNNYEILYVPFKSDIKNGIFLSRFSEKKNQIYWLNNDYIAFDLAGRIIISEIDVRGNINAIELPNSINLENGEHIDIGDLKIYFSQRDKKLYLLTQNKLLSSEKLIP